MKTLFDLPLAHRNDPITSYEAGDRMLNSGKLVKQQKLVMTAIITQRFENWTAKELSIVSGIDYFVIQRRLHELAHKGLIERTGKKREDCCVWKEKGKNE